MEKNFLQHFHGQSLAGEVLRGVAMGRIIQHIPQHQNFAYIEECCLDGDAAGVQRAFLCAAEKDDICARFASLSTKFRTAGDSHLQLLTASLMNEADVVLFVSYSGATRDMMETLRTAKAAGAKIILLTHYEDSPGALLADVVLLCGAQESPLDSGSIPIKAAFLYVGEVLVLRYMLDDPAHSNTAQDLTSEALTVKML